MDGRAVRGPRQRSGNAALGRQLNRHRAMPAASGGWGGGVPFLHVKSRGPYLGDLPHAGRARAGSGARAERRIVTNFLDYLKDRILLCDGAIGTEVQAMALDVERDFWGHEN